MLNMLMPQAALRLVPRWLSFHTESNISVRLTSCIFRKARLCQDHHYGVHVDILIIKDSVRLTEIESNPNRWKQLLEHHPIVEMRILGFKKDNY